MRFPSEPFRIKIVEPSRQTTHVDSARANVEHPDADALDLVTTEAYDQH